MRFHCRTIGQSCAKGIVIELLLAGSNSIVEEFPHVWSTHCETVAMD